MPAYIRHSEPQRKALENLLRNAQPASTQAQIEYVEPRFRIGFQSMIGFDSVIARDPASQFLELCERHLGVHAGAAEAA